MNISYLTDPVEQYQAGINEAQNREELINRIVPYELIANDALQIANSKTFDWDEFKAGLIKERNKEFAGEKWAKKYMAIIMPDVMFQISMTAAHFGAPWGVAYIQMKRAGLLKEVDGVAIITVRKESDSSNLRRRKTKANKAK